MTLEARVAFEEGCINREYNVFLLLCDCCGVACKEQIALIEAHFNSYYEGEFLPGLPVLFGGAEEHLVFGPDRLCLARDRSATQAQHMQLASQQTHLDLIGGLTHTSIGGAKLWCLLVIAAHE